MKVGYKRPTIEFEDFELNTVISAGCAVHVNLGPGGDGEHDTCTDYGGYDDLRIKPEIGVMDNDPIGDSFYEGSCSCFLSSVGSTLLTS